MAANLSQARDIAKYFQMSGISTRPEACEQILRQLQQLTYYDHKRAYIDQFLKHLKEWQSLSQSTAAGNGVSILDQETALKIMSIIPTSAIDTMTQDKNQKNVSSFKMRKMQAKLAAQEPVVINQDGEDVEMANGEAQVLKPKVSQIKEIFIDKVLKQVHESVVILEDFQEFPNIQTINGQIYFQVGTQRSFTDVIESRASLYANRLALMEERVFSHTDKYKRPKLRAQGQEDDDNLSTVNHVHSIVGSTSRKWILGLLAQREDANYYLEDSTLTVKVSFAELEYAEPDALFTENCIILCCGEYHNETFYLTHIMHPPLHARKSFLFKLNEHDYFGSYSKQQKAIQNKVEQQQSTQAQTLISSKTKESIKVDKEPCLVVLSQLELDTPGTQRSLRTLLEGLEQMKPDIIILIGDFISEKNAEKQTYDQFSHDFEVIGSIIRENDYKVLRDLTSWILVPSVNDPGQTKLMPCLKLSDFLVQAFKGNGPQRIKNITFATNPMRISYYGKEIVISKYNYFKKLKRNHLPRVQMAQERSKQDLPQEEAAFEETYRVAKTIVHQGSLMPLPQIIQPIIWSFGDCLNLTPHPNYLILADDCQDYYHKVKVDAFSDEPDQYVHVVNPGNFSLKKSFVVIYPTSDEVQPSNVPA